MRNDGTSSLARVGLHQPVEAREGERRVEEDAALDERGPERPTAVEREQEREAMHEVRRDGPGQGAPLVVRLADEPHVSEAQVAQAAVDQLRRRARRARAEVPRVDERDREPGAGGVRGGRRADHAASDHEQVERRPLERLSRGGPARLRVIGYAHRGFVHARRPAGSTTSTPGEGRVAGQVEPRRDDVVLGRDLEDLRSVAVAQPARVHRRPARPPGQQRHRAGRRAPHDHVAVPHLDVVDQRAGAAVEPSRAQRVEDALRRPLGADPRPRVVGVEARMVAVVGHEARDRSGRPRAARPSAPTTGRDRPRARTPR